MNEHAEIWDAVLGVRETPTADDVAKKELSEIGKRTPVKLTVPNLFIWYVKFGNWEWGLRTGLSTQKLNLVSALWWYGLTETRLDETVKKHAIRSSFVIELK